jgi:hypothetical protein
MTTYFSEVKTRVEELCDGRSFTAAKHARWANGIRKAIAMDFDISGFNGLYFLYKEATVKDGSVTTTGKYAMPDDYIDHLQVFYDGTPLTQPQTGVLDLAHTRTATGTPEWVEILGTEFRLVPIADTAGDEIKLLYNALPADIPTTSNDGSSDYFINHFPELHIFGMAELGALSLGAAGSAVASKYEQKYGEEKAKLTLHNRRHWIKSAKLRYANWDEYTDYKRIVFPQIQET